MIRDNLTPVTVLIETLVLCSEKAADIARLIRTQYALFPTLIQHKSHKESGKNFAADVMTLADVLIQQSIRHDIEKEFPGFGGSVYGEENSVFRAAQSGENIQLTIPQTLDELRSILSHVLVDQQSLAGALAELILSPLSHFRLRSALREHLVSISQLDISAQLDLTQFAVWVDPIDGTAEYVKGNTCDVSSEETRAPSLDVVSPHVFRYHISGTLGNVTVLIGLYDRTSRLPVFGVINQPFFPHVPANLGDSQSSGRLFWGSTLGGSYLSSNCLPSSAPSITKCFPDWSLQKLSSSSDSLSDVGVLWVACSFSDFDSLERILKDCTPPVDDDLPPKLVFVSCAGAGFKLLCIILCQLDIYLLLKPNTYFWDTCAPHALLRARGGGLIRLKPALSYVREQSMTGVCDLDPSALREFEVHYSVKPSDYTDLSSCCNLDGLLAYRDGRVACHFLQRLARSVNTVDELFD
ncbi:Inositol polyphosphate 1-phosphatase [Clonorchis sinensis]|uniref:inositol-1,4-bisphosphate 1-phosphatase n=1 Tax=Clonorchis sinensis TaxID=79923 RepID=A0A8T1MWI5_CLOSI|nr:Inositol polyphosphate 1-phosphatase [Clonorchis sinensis]